MDIQKNGFLSIEQVKDQYLNQGKTKPSTNTSEVSFGDILKEKSQIVLPKQEVKFSKHASLRLENRNISLSESQMARLNNATQKASEKGIKESLVIMDSLAFIVNIPNNTVVTALDGAESSENVFTNIDGAVII
ncbi:MAG: flagellar protein [Lachnospiraceae bacterium]|nr:flagellar protein [Lachnospiraceae bacterium]